MISRNLIDIVSFLIEISINESLKLIMSYMLLGNYLVLYITFRKYWNSPGHLMFISNMKLGDQLI